MKERLAGFLLMTAVVPLALLGYLILWWVGLFGKAERGRQGVRALDHFVNATVFNGYAWESVSSHAWRERERRWWAPWVIRIANLFPEEPLPARQQARAGGGRPDPAANACMNRRSAEPAASAPGAAGHAPPNAGAAPASSSISAASTRKGRPTTTGCTPSRRRWPARSAATGSRSASGARRRARLSAWLRLGGRMLADRRSRRTARCGDRIRISALGRHRPRALDAQCRCWPGPRPVRTTRCTCAAARCGDGAAVWPPALALFMPFVLLIGLLLQRCSAGAAAGSRGVAAAGSPACGSGLAGRRRPGWLRRRTRLAWSAERRMNMQWLLRSYAFTGRQGTARLAGARSPARQFARRIVERPRRAPRRPPRSTNC